MIGRFGLIRSMIGRPGDLVEKLFYRPIFGSGRYLALSSEKTYTIGSGVKIRAKIITSQNDSDFAIIDGYKFSAISGYAIIYVDNPDGIEVLIGIGSDQVRYILGGQSEVCDGEEHEIVVAVLSSSIELYIDDMVTPFNSVARTDGNTIIKFEPYVFGGYSRYMSGISTGFSIELIDNPANSLIFPLDDGYTQDLTARETSQGDDGIYYPFTESDFTEI